MSTATQKREALATLIRATLDDAWTVYASPSPQYTFPAVVITPRNPYRSRFTFDGEAVMLSIRVMVQPTAQALDIIDDVFDDLVMGSEPLLDTPSMVECDIQGVQLVTSGGDVLVGTIDVTVA